MDFKVYKKEEVLQPDGTGMEVYVPDIIDLIPKFEHLKNADGSEGAETNIIENAVIYEDDKDSKSLLEQECSLATIWQKGLDPLEKDDGVRWSQALLEEINPIQLMNDIISAVSKITYKVAVVFDTITDKEGRSFLTYTLRAIA